MANADEEKNEAPPLEEALNEAVESKINSQAATAAAAYAQVAKEAEKMAQDAAENADAVDETVESEADILRAELADRESSLKRLRADFENFRRRTNKEKEESQQYAKEEMLKAMLPLVDNFERAMATEDKTSDSFLQGVTMIYTQFNEILKNFGLTEIEAAGNMFDPEFHQAVGRVASETLPEGAIAEVFQKGYKLNEKVLRPSMVQVVGN